MSTPSTAQRRRILLTGATGFVGQAVLLALLELTDDVDPIAVVRPGRGSSARERLDALLAKPSFAGFVSARGEEGAREEFFRRVGVIEGDLTGLERNQDAIAYLREVGELHAAIHCASAVSFDLPIDEAFDTNVGGAVGLYGVLDAAGLDPHVVHVSTAYVGGSARGLRTEGPLPHTVDWEAERAWADEVRREAEVESRKSEALAGHLRVARIMHGKEGPHAIAAAAEEARLVAIKQELVDAGRLRAQTLGWTDVYTFTKAMAERVAETQWAGRGKRLSVVRPSIIESSHQWPFPGWIDGYKVADPLIMAYARGMLKQFPALPDSLLDVVPVDMIVGVVVALALGEYRRSGADAYYQVVSGTTNPLPFHAMVDAVRSYFTNHPQKDARGRDIEVPLWTYSRGPLVESVIGAQEKALRIGEVAASLVPRGTQARRWSGTLHKQRAGLTTLRKYVDLYKNYTRSELVFDDRHTRQLLDDLSEVQPDGQRVMRDGLIGFDIAAVDWWRYLTEHHMPAIVTLTRDYSASRDARRRSESDKADAPIAPAEGVIAVFDLDGTVASATVVMQHIALQPALRGATGTAGELASMLWNAPSYVAAERRDRSEFLRRFARRFQGLKLADLERAVQGEYAEKLRASVRKDALARIEEHRAAGHRTVLVTGVPAPLVAPLGELFDEIAATQLDVRDGVLTGYLTAPPVVDEARAGWLLRYANANGADLASSYGYGDSQSDVTWLSLLGHPFAVDPDLGLNAEAKRNRWPVLDWH
ncbi:SDR family oxidoreductase [Nigerium massiliense]|uniref:SDR family oxidoreductase n=1 Tax=Nigerium massiliense TaxID=1522317 RepID=UPI00058CA462|nr:SDR family oxidoreductase [Nigerium massiliense]